MRLHAYDERSEEAFQDISKRSQPRFKKRLLVKDMWCHILWGAIVETLATPDDAS